MSVLYLFVLFVRKLMGDWGTERSKRTLVTSLGSKTYLGHVRLTRSVTYAQRTGDATTGDSQGR
jgi:hypothetical protein